MPGDDAARLIIGKQHRLARAVCIRSQSFDICLHIGVQIGIDLASAAKAVGGEEGQAFQLFIHGAQVRARRRPALRLDRQPLSECPRVFLFPQPFQFPHPPQHAVARFFAPFGGDEGGIIVGRADDGRQRRPFGGAELFRAFPEVVFRRPRDAVTGVPEVDGVQIHLKDLVFCIALFQKAGELDLFELSPQRLFARQVGVFDQLLADGGSALHERPRAEVFIRRPRHARVVQPVVAVKFFVFRGQKGAPHAQGDMAKAHAARRALERNIRDLLSVPVQDARRLRWLLQQGGLQLRVRRDLQPVRSRRQYRREQQAAADGGDGFENFHAVHLIFLQYLNFGGNYFSRGKLERLEKIPKRLYNIYYRCRCAVFSVQGRACKL